MAGQPIRRERFGILDEIGLEKIARFYIEEVQNVPELVEMLFPPMGEGKKAGATLFYEWLNFRGYREQWKRLVEVKKEIREAERWDSMYAGPSEWLQND